MSFTEQDLDNLSTLARIDIAPEEKAKMLLDMQAILGYISEINEVPHSALASRGEEGTATREKEIIFNITREDIITREPGSNTEAILREAPATEDRYVKVEQVMK